MTEKFEGWGSEEPIRCCLECGLTGDRHLAECSALFKAEISELKAALSESIGTWAERFNLQEAELSQLRQAAKNALECLDSIDKSDDPQLERATEELRAAIRE